VKHHCVAAPTSCFLEFITSLLWAHPEKLKAKGMHNNTAKKVTRFLLPPSSPFTMQMISIPRLLSGNMPFIPPQLQLIPAM